MNASPFIASAWEHVALASLHGAVLIVVVVLVQRSLKNRLGPAWSFSLWFLVLLRLSSPSLPVSTWSWQRLAEVFSRQPSPAVPSASIPEFPSVSGGVNLKPVLSAVSPVAAPPLIGVNSSPRPFGPTDSWTSGPDGAADHEHLPTAWWGILWGVGALVLLARQGLAAWVFRKRLSHWPQLGDGKLMGLVMECRQQMGITRRVDFRILPHIESPCLFGVVRPAILLPSCLVDTLTDVEWRNILLHEFAHLKRWDPLWNAWMSLLRCIHWFNPIVWWAVNRMREDRELACDSLVLSHADSATRRSYGATLLKLASRPAALMQPAAVVGILENGGPLKARLHSLQDRPRFWLNAAVGIVVLISLGACALTRKPEADGSPGIQPVDLSAHTDYPQAAIASTVLQKHRDDPGMWSQIPKGEQKILGVPFDITGLIRLACMSPQREEWYFRPRADGISIDRPFGRLYLLHATYYYANPGTVIARARINYADGTFAELPIKYGNHTLNYWRQRYEIRSQPVDSESRIAWTGNSPMLAEYGNSLRLCISSFNNPRPKEMVRSIDLTSTWQDPAEVVVGMAVGGRELPAEWRKTSPIQEPEQRWQAHVRFRAVDFATGQPIPDMTLRLEVAEEGVHSRISTYSTDKSGWATIKYPHRDLRYISIWANHDRYVPRFIQWTRHQHGAYPEEYVYRAEAGVRIAGRVEDQAGRPVAGSMVRLEGPRPDFAGDAKEFLMLTQIYATTDADGRWNSSAIPRGLPADQIQIRVLHPDFMADPPVILSPAELAGAEIRTRLSGGVVVAGIVVNTEKNPLAGAKVLVRSRSHVGEIRGTRTDATGAFTLRLAPGVDRPAAALPEFSPTSLPTVQLARGLNASEVLVEAAGYAPWVHQTATHGSLDWPTSPIVLSRGRTIEVVVQDAEKRPIEGALVERIVAGGLTLDNPMTTDRNGRARWMHAPDALFALQIRHEGYQHNQIPVMDGATNLPVQLAPTEMLTGSVTDAKTGRGIPFFKVWMGRRGPDSDEIVWDAQPSSIGRQGSYQVRNHNPSSDALVFRIEAPKYATSKALPAHSLRSQPPFEIKLNAL